MRAIAKIYSPETQRRAARLWRWRMSSVNLSARHGMLRWLAWTESLVSRSAHLSLPTSSGQRTLLRGTWRWLRRSQWSVPQLQFTWQTSVNAIWQGRERIHVPCPTPSIDAHTTLLQTVLAHEYRNQTTTLVRTGSLRQLTKNYLREATRHTLVRVISEHAAAALTMPQCTLVASTNRKWSGAWDLEQSLVVKRVLRQNQRIEEHVTARPQTVLLRRAAPVVQESGSVETPVVPQARRASTNAAWSASAPQSGFNISQITDAVVRQLDNRLVAARERFGKI